MTTLDHLDEKEKTEDFVQEETETEQEQTVRKKKGKLAKRVFVIIALCFCAYAAFTIIYDKAEVSRLKGETAEITRQIDEEKALNDEYSRMLDSGEKEYMKKIAIDKLGYAYPEERRFYIVNQDK